MIVVDYHIVESVNVYDFGASTIFTDVLKWLLININNALEYREQQLVTIRPGAVSTTSEPRLVWVTMLRCPSNTNRKSVFALTRKFNQALELVIAKDKRSHILKVHVEDSENNFDTTGELTAIGQVQYWRAIDDEMKDFDHGKTELTPTVKSELISKPVNHYEWHNSSKY